MPALEPRSDLGEFCALQWTRTELCRLLRDFFRVTRPTGAPPVRVGTDLPFYYDPTDKLARFTPDVYVLEGLGEEEVLRSFRVWERGVRPSLLIHLVDSAVAPEDGLLMHCARLGAEDIVLFDPLWSLQPAASPCGRRPLWHYHQADGLTLQTQEHPGRVALPRHGLWLCHRGGSELRLYAGGAEVFPSEAACWPTSEEQLLALRSRSPLPGAAELEKADPG